MAKRKPKPKLGRPPTGVTPVRQLGRVDNSTWYLIQKAAALKGQTLTAYMVGTLTKSARRIVDAEK